MVDNFIIEGRSRRSQARRIVEGFLTLIMWVGFLYLMKGVFGFLFVHSGLSFFKDWEGSKSAVAAVSRSLKSYGFIIAANTVMFVGWALYNQLVFGKRNRRRVAAVVETKEIGAFFGLSADQVRACQTTQEIAMRHDRSGALVECNACPELNTTTTEIP